MARADDITRANWRAAERRKLQPRAVTAKFDRTQGKVVVELSTGLTIAFRPRDAQGLEKASPAELSPIEISPSGFGLHFPRLEADLYLPALLEGFFGSRKWAAAQLGARGGKARSAAKASAARVNGALGGRPRKRQSALA